MSTRPWLALPSFDKFGFKGPERHLDVPGLLVLGVGRLGSNRLDLCSPGQLVVEGLHEGGSKDGAGAQNSALQIPLLGQPVLLAGILHLAIPDELFSLLISFVSLVSDLLLLPESTVLLRKG